MVFTMLIFMKFTNAEYCYVVCGLYQHIPSFEDVIRFHGICINVTSLMPVRKYGFHRADFHEIHEC
jgi:hypothetical protein